MPMKLASILCAAVFSATPIAAGMIDKAVLSENVARFNADDEELHKNHIPNSSAEQFLSDNIPLFDCPDREIQRTYYFRWWTFRKHIRETGENQYVVTEFLPNVRWAGLHNAISCPAAHHFAEGRWLRNDAFLRSYARYWFACGKDIRRYSFGAANSILEFYKARGDVPMLSEHYPKMKENVAEWEKSHRDASGLFWQSDDRDGMEVSISGALQKDKSGYRATINSYMYGEYAALAKIAEIMGLSEDAAFYTGEAAKLKDLINSRLWDASARFYKVVPLGSEQFSDARELHGYTPWWFGIPPETHSDAWKQLSDAGGFRAPYGPTSAEQRHPGFSVSYEGHECQWNGPSWPFATSVTLVALANFINEYPPCAWADSRLYFDMLQTYAMSHHRILESGRRVMWIDENLNPYTGDWISRTRLEKWDNGKWSERKGGRERGKDYNHSQFCNHIISGLVGVRPDCGDSITVNPLIPDAWNWFCLENVPVKGRAVTVFFDRDGTRYGRAKGLSVLIDGEIAAHSASISKLKIAIRPNR